MIEALGMFAIFSCLVGGVISRGDERDAFFGAALVAALIVTFAIFV